jgi:hypothetical protein
MADLMLGDPVLARQPRVEHAVGDIARHLLRANEHAVDLGIVDRGKVRSRVDEDREPRALEQLHRRLFERPLRKTQFEFHAFPTSR